MAIYFGGLCSAMKISATISDKKKHDPIIGVRVLIVSQALKRIIQWQYTTEWFTEVNLLKPLSTDNELISAKLCSRSLVWILRIQRNLFRAFSFFFIKK